VWKEDGEAAVLREDRCEEGTVDAGGGPRARVLRAGARARQLARRAHQHRCVITGSTRRDHLLPCLRPSSSLPAGI
jgi:hypothetical protein